MCAAGKDTDFGKPAQFLKSLKAPYYAVPLSPDILDTDGGLSVNTNSQVLKKDNQPIPGLYAAGSVANPEVSSAEYYSTGFANFSANIFGRQAGDQAAAYAKAK
ncbi:MAG: FAD-binding protein [Clostridiales bacterium]|jgi:fumarate reductase flavoprotein subunit|nr:FAD-binding protein [Eubacteriales bacterium]MDH7566968.1 FAD-binding protein [Clostridiales bacterium]